ncbi:MAG: tyrosine-type recombinase/integrase [Candidatus Thiodiazotropha lotti]|uniref:Tyrosine-type recombinase/integrase n=1 Tax=Candidatus Thiodiazotropha lotti TaxID=2792787 RepID=A0A9E4K5N1_9GAMM|nr:tyrosine-type recombinase/integrase [Candidatus Thiodiazotropha lotti]MCG7939609.1 tyrosine-type recombinase/integrase [Candidatus Thiodiazotropha lotti]MCW4204082.1 tyrosine-type recombinase/integrase [Candidatus Thiodiazotropha lotti]MCW4222464.1 tyrosine-type recombinase/integrase [Candidatus Thiodiazotropha lotti]
MPLTDSAIRNAKPKEKNYKLADGGGLYLLVTTKGGKWWRLDYRFNGKRKTLSMGVYPDVTLKSARDRRAEAKTQLADGIDPGEIRKATKASKSDADGFEAVAREWWGKREPTWSKTHSSRIIQRLEKDVFPWIGNRPIREISAPELLTVLRRIENRGALETAHRIHQSCGQIFRYAVATGRAQRDPSADLKGALPPTRQKHHASITEPKKIGELLRVIEGYEGSLVTRCALQLASLTFVRPGELRHAEWSEINLEKAEWRIPPEKMKMRTLHIVPLSQQSLSVLNEIKPLTGRGKYVFPGVRTNRRPMSENTVNAALRRLGYTKEEMTGHGFRSMASTILNEQGWHRDAIERQLAHAERNSVRAAYNYAEHMPERIKMMQWWADYLDNLKTGAEIIPINKNA